MFALAIDNMMPFYFVDSKYSLPKLALAQGSSNKDHVEEPDFLGLEILGMLQTSLFKKSCQYNSDIRCVTKNQSLIH